MDNLNKDKISENKENNVPLEELIKKNIEISEEILSLSKYIKRYVIWQKIMAWLKIFIILIPIILAFIYLPPFLKELSESLNSFLLDPSSLLMDATNK